MQSLKCKHKIASQIFKVENSVSHEKNAEMCIDNEEVVSWSCTQKEYSGNMN